jgi:hypothetical protein
MGYDLHARVTPIEVDLAHAAAQDGSGAWSDYFHKQNEHACYWRESVWSISKLRSVFAYLDMLTDEPGPQNPDEPTEGPIPVERLSSNDGWVITAAQCTTLAAALELKLKVEPNAVAEVYVNGTYGLVDDAEKVKPISDALGLFADSNVQVYTGQGAEDIEDAVVDLQLLHRFLHYCATEGDGFVVW